ncbi:hypothetical protein [Streptomyces otsuchiensis]|uniref:hypothetical protein n=1 Tax=Streptomyces otsuchiensis TaxID=2681388 RepID=UPI001030227B|nr:hypothetical protein [Streptomyces otsuchiensis]
MGDSRDKAARYGMIGVIVTAVCGVIGTLLFVTLGNDSTSLSREGDRPQATETDAGAHSEPGRGSEGGAGRGAEREPDGAVDQKARSGSCADILTFNNWNSRGTRLGAYVWENGSGLSACGEGFRHGETVDLSVEYRDLEGAVVRRVPFKEPLVVNDAEGFSGIDHENLSQTLRGNEATAWVVARGESSRAQTQLAYDPETSVIIDG